MAGQKALVTVSVTIASFPELELQAHILCLAFAEIPGIKTQVLMLEQQVPLPTEPFPQAPFLLFLSKNLREFFFPLIFSLLEC